MDSASLLEGLSDEQRQAVTTEAAPLCILAGAGTGKTRVLTRRIAYRAVTGTLDPRRVLVLSFTRAAAAELVARLRLLGLRDAPTAGTFHSIAYAQLRRRFASRHRIAPTVVEHRVGLVARQLSAGMRAWAAEVTTEIDWAKARVVSPSGYESAALAAGRAPVAGLAAVAAAYAGYERTKHERGLVDFDDLLWLAIDELETSDDAAALRWAHQHLFVDEMQDVNPLQARLLRAWLGPGKDLCVVGDPNQAIYAWNGADPDLIERFDEHFPTATIVKLSRNHRSSPQVLALANRVLDAGALPGVRLFATRPDGPEPRLARAASAADEAAAVVTAARARHDRNIPWSHQAVLVRTNAQVAPIAEALRAAGIPIRVRATRPFTELPAVKEALGQLRKLGMVAGLAALEDLERELEHSDEERAAVAELVRLGGEFMSTDPAPTPAGFSGWLATATADDVATSEQGMAVSTFHAAKGLEWPVVHVAGLEDGLVPHARAASPGALAEERRLFHVALTRAERELHLSWAATRELGSKEVRRRPSPFLAELQPVFAAMAEASRSVQDGAMATTARERVRAARTSQGAPVALAEPPVVAALKAWRAAKAKGALVEPSQVLDDRELAALCSAAPTDADGVASVVGVVRARRIADELVAVIAGAVSG